MSGKSLSHGINVLGGSRQSVSGARHSRAGFPLRRPQPHTGAAELGSGTPPEVLAEL